MLPNESAHSDKLLLEVPAFISDTFRNMSIEFILRENNQILWNNVLNRSNYVPFGYLDNTIQFQKALQSGNGTSLSDISVIILHDRKPCAVWPMLYKPKAEDFKISGFGTNLLPPLFVADIVATSKKEIIKKCIRFLEVIGKQISVDTIQCEEVFLSTLSVSDMHYELVKKGSVAKLRYDLFVDLSMDMDKIKNRFRKSYKSLINKGLALWRIGILENDQPLIWEEFRQLHIKVTGRETRTRETWAVHYLAILQGMAFLIYLRNDLDEMIGGGLFIHSKQECFYGVGAYDRSLFDKPIGHVVQFAAIEVMKKRGLQWYKVGTRSFKTDIPTPSEKEISVTEFKEGFATNIFPKYLLALSCES